MWRCHQLLSGFLAKGHLTRVSRQSRLPAGDKCDNEMKPGAVHRSATYHTAEENSGNSAKRPSDKKLRDQLSSQMGSLTPNESHHASEGKRRKGREGITMCATKGLQGNNFNFFVKWDGVFQIQNESREILGFQKSMNKGFSSKMYVTANTSCSVAYHSLLYS